MMIVFYFCVELSFCTMNQHFVVHFVLLFVCTRTFAVRMSRLRKVNFILLPAIEMRKYSPPDESDLWKTQILVTLLLSSPWNSLKTAVSSVGWPGMKVDLLIKACFCCCLFILIQNHRVWDHWVPELTFFQFLKLIKHFFFFCFQNLHTCPAPWFTLSKSFLD